MIRLPLLLCLAVALALSSACDGRSDGATSSPIAGSATPSPSAGPTITPGEIGPAITPGEIGPTPTPTTPPGGTTYTVQPGDTIYSIASRFGTTVAVIAKANNMSDPNKVMAGQVLIIPGVSGVTPAPTPSPAPGSAQVIRKGSPNRRMVALTFDAGSDTGYAALILDTLKANGIHASFGMTGQWAEGNPDLLKRMVDEGHTVINHTYDHFSFTGSSTHKPPLTQAQRWEELDKTDSIIQQLTGVSAKPYFRPPYGDYDDSVNADVGARGYQYNVMWSVDSGGWRGISAEEITQRSLNGASPGAIIVMHVGVSSKDGPALQGIIDGLRAAGYSFGTLPEVLAP